MAMSLPLSSQEEYRFFQNELSKKWAEISELHRNAQKCTHTRTHTHTHTFIIAAVRGSSPLLVSVQRSSSLLFPQQQQQQQQQALSLTHTHTHAQTGSHTRSRTDRLTHTHARAQTHTHTQ